MLRGTLESIALIFDLVRLIIRCSTQPSCYDCRVCCFQSVAILAQVLLAAHCRLEFLDGQAMNRKRNHNELYKFAALPTVAAAKPSYKQRSAEHIAHARDVEAATRSKRQAQSADTQKMTPK